MYSPDGEIDTVKAEISKAAATSWDITAARVQAFYQVLSTEFYTNLYHGSPIRLDLAAQG